MKHFCAHTLTWSSWIWCTWRVFKIRGLEHAETRRRATSSQKMCIKKRWVHVSRFLGAWWTNTPAGHELVAWGEAPCGVIKDESNFFMHTCLAICIKGMRVYKECICKAFALFHYHVIILYLSFWSLASWFVYSHVMKIKFDHGVTSHIGTGSSLFAGCTDSSSWPSSMNSTWRKIITCSLLKTHPGSRISWILQRNTSMFGESTKDHFPLG